MARAIDPFEAVLTMHLEELLQVMTHGEAPREARMPGAGEEPPDVDDMSYEEVLALEERMGRVSTGLGAAGIERVTTAFLFSEEEAKRRRVQGELKCSVCLCEFEEGDEVRLLRCGHLYHRPCIDHWLAYDRRCPICRREADSGSAPSSPAPASPPARPPAPAPPCPGDRGRGGREQSDAGYDGDLERALQLSLAEEEQRVRAEGRTQEAVRRSLQAVAETQAAVIPEAESPVGGDCSGDVDMAFALSLAQAEELHTNRSLGRRERAAGAAAMTMAIALSLTQGEEEQRVLSHTHIAMQRSLEGRP